MQESAVSQEHPYKAFCRKAAELEFEQDPYQKWFPVTELGELKTFAELTA